MTDAGGNAGICQGRKSCYKSRIDDFGFIARLIFFQIGNQENPWVLVLSSSGHGFSFFFSGDFRGLLIKISYFADNML